MKKTIPFTKLIKSLGYNFKVISYTEQIQDQYDIITKDQFFQLISDFLNRDLHEIPVTLEEAKAIYNTLNLNLWYNKKRNQKLITSAHDLSNYLFDLISDPDIMYIHTKSGLHHVKLFSKFLFDNGWELITYNQGILTYENDVFITDRTYKDFLNRTQCYDTQIWHMLNELKALNGEYQFASKLFKKPTVLINSRVITKDCGKLHNNPKQFNPNLFVPTWGMGDDDIVRFNNKLNVFGVYNKKIDEITFEGESFSWFKKLRDKYMNILVEINKKNNWLFVIDKPNLHLSYQLKQFSFDITFIIGIKTGS